MSKHTPGPWTWDEPHPVSDELGDERHFWRLTGSSRDVLCATNDGDVFVRGADARLIAAAPELLEACEGAAKTLGIMAGAGDVLAAVARYKLLETIAKARGE
jgi:hypothetical protein